MVYPHFAHQVDAYGVPDRQRIMERWAPPRIVKSKGEWQGQPAPSVLAIARPGWETGVPKIAPFSPLNDFLDTPVVYFTTYNIEKDHSARVHPFSRDIGRFMEFCEMMIAVQPDDDLLRTLTLSRLQDTTNSTGLQDLSQGPVDLATSGRPTSSETIGIVSGDGVSRPDPVDDLAGSGSDFPSLPVLAPNFAATVQPIRGAKRELNGQIVAARQTQQENSLQVATSR
jgi:hypothetical protein